MNKTIIFAILSILLIGIPYLNYKYEKFYNEVPKEIKIEAVVISNVKKNEYYNSYQIKGKNSIFKNKKFILYTKENLEFGDKVEIGGEFSNPDGQRNYRGFNYKKYLKTQKIYGVIKAKKVTIVSKNNLNFVLIFTNNIRNKIIKSIKKILPEETSTLLTGILLGEKTDLNEEITTSFQKSSLSHVLAVSGTHVSYLILGITLFLNKSKISKKSGYYIIIFILVLFLLLTNFSPSVVRASIMASLVIVAKILHRKASALNSILISLLIILINNPYLVNNISLQLSYLGTIGVIYIAPIVQKQIQKLNINKKISKVLSIPISAQIAILPIIITNFNTISLTFLISNISVIPLIGVVIILGFITVLISFVWMWGAQSLGIIINLILKTIIGISKFCGNLKISSIYIITPNKITIIIYYFILVIIIYIFNLKKLQNFKHFEKKFLHFYSKIPKKKVVLILIIIIVLIEIPYVNFNGKLKIFFIDVGQRR